MDKTSARTPKKHQFEASNLVQNVFTYADRANIILPCGTGKTYIGEIVAEAMAAQTILLLFPSIALIKQTLGFWRETGALTGATVLCVCSDKTVADSDEVEVSEEELGLKITTSSLEVSQVFGSSSNKIIVFCTYQSAPTLSAGMPQGFAFDIGVFDEAHRTVSDKDSLFSYALVDDNLKISKRLFMTATPRHIIQNEEDGKSYSMDDESVYGKNAYVLPIREAINQGLISDYQVLISAVTSSELEAELNKEDAALKNDNKMVAMAIALQKAMQFTGAHKVFSFHATINSARKFTENSQVKTILNCDLFHVSGAMSSQARANIINEFAASEESIVTNARCLTEGVDVPAVDMVVFADPKESTVDIVQAAGRAMRTSENKTSGYILLPVFIDVNKWGDDIDGAVKASGMSMIWEVLSRMSEQETLIAYKSASKAEQREARKSRIDYKIIASQPGMVEKLKNSIDIYYAQRNFSVFDENYARLQEYMKEKGHCNPKSGDDETLVQWVKNIRFKYQKGLLSKENTERMNALGFFWNGRDHLWDIKFKDYLDGNGTVKWISVQRTQYRDGTLPEDRKQKLIDAGFPFETELTAARMTESEKFNQTWDDLLSRVGMSAMGNGQIKCIARALGLDVADKFDYANSPLVNYIHYVYTSSIQAVGDYPEGHLEEQDLTILKLMTGVDFRYEPKKEMRMLFKTAGMFATDEQLTVEIPSVTLNTYALMRVQEQFIFKALEDIKLINGVRTIKRTNNKHQLWLSAVWLIAHSWAKTNGFHLDRKETKLAKKADELMLSVTLPNDSVFSVADAIHERNSRLLSA